MRKWIITFSPLIMIVIFTSFGSRDKVTFYVPDTLKMDIPTIVSQPQFETEWMPLKVAPYLGSSFTGFKEALAFKESQGNYFIINTFGYLGKYQFGIGTLRLMGVDNATTFLNDPRLQEKVFQTNIARNKWILRKDIEMFEGYRIRGSFVTESGILAAAHLAGPGNVRKYLRTNGKWDVKDAYGTSIHDYLTRFSGYDISKVPARRNPQIKM